MENLPQETTAEKQEANTHTDASVSELSSGIPKLWPPAMISASEMDDPTANASIILFFHGLMSFINFGDKRCDVGIHNQDPDHESIVYVAEFSDTLDLLHAIPISDLKNADPFTFTVEKPVPGRDKVSFFQHQDIFRRDTTNDHEHDFRWLIDLEGPEFYNTPLRLKPETLRPTLHVHNGLFYTYLRTMSTFKRKGSDGALFLGPIAYIVAANVYLDNGGTATLRIGKQEMTFSKASGKKHAILFLNSCPPKKCVFDPRGPRKESRNDFHMYYRTFDLPTGRPEFELIAETIASPTSLNVQSLFSPVTGPQSSSILDSLFKKFSTDPAPCGGGGHSGG